MAKQLYISNRIEDYKGGKFIQFGNKISEFYNHHRRAFRPNVNRQTLWSETLNRRITLKIVASVLRTITKEGGLDNYLIKDTSARIKQLGPLGWKLRYMVLTRLQKQETSRPKPSRKLENGDSIIRVYAKHLTKTGDEIKIVKTVVSKSTANPV